MTFEKCFSCSVTSIYKLSERIPLRGPGLTSSAGRYRKSVKILYVKS